MVSHEVIFFTLAYEPSDLNLDQVVDGVKLLILLSANGALQYRPFIFPLLSRSLFPWTFKFQKLKGEEET
jgi:hypothetical protein